MIHRLTALTCALAALVFAGCSKTETSVPAAAAQTKMAEIAAMYKGYTKDHKKPPRQLSDFDHPYEPANIDGYAALRSGECVMIWGGSMPGASAGTTVVAYEKAAPSQGGLALFQDGTIKQVTADEFKAAPKAK